MLEANWIDNLPTAARQAVHAAMLRRQYEPGQAVYRSGEPSTTIFQLVSGAVHFTELSENGREVLYSIGGPGACFGMLPAVDGTPRFGTAVAAEVTVLGCLRKVDFDRLRDLHPAIDRALVVWAFQHLREIGGRLIENQQRDLRRHLARQIVFLLRYAGPLGDGRTRDTLDITHEVLAASVGATRQGISNIVRDWSEAGIVHYHYGRFRVLDLKRLDAVAHAEQE